MADGVQINLKLVPPPDNRCQLDVMFSKIQHVFNRFEWRRTALLYDSAAYEEYVGQGGGFLLASTVHEYLTVERFEIHAWELQLQFSLEDQLIQHVGNNYASEFCFGSLFESNSIRIWGIAEL